MKTRTVTDCTLLPVILTIKQTAAIMGMSYDWTQKAARSGKIPAFKIGKRKWLINRDDLMHTMHTNNI